MMSKYGVVSQHIYIYIYIYPFCNNSGALSPFVRVTDASASTATDDPLCFLKYKKRGQKHVLQHVQLYR